MAAAASSSLRTLARRASFCTKVHHKQPPQNHTFQSPSPYVGSWSHPKDPKEAEARLAQLRRDYAKQVKQVRKQYIEEVTLMRLEKQRKDEARKEALRKANEERKRVKAEAAKVRAQERKLAEQQFRELLLKERREKLEYWRMTVKKVEEKKKEKKELIRQQSSLWVDEEELPKKSLNEVVATTLL